ncbi:MAG: hypothetical protein ACO3K9_07210, partial [Paracoccaceae bacterium]
APSNPTFIMSCSFLSGESVPFFTTCPNWHFALSECEYSGRGSAVSEFHNPCPDYLNGILTGEP